MDNELVSIIMPVYNGEANIAESIASVLSQTYSLWELIIVDDCSTDNTGDIIAQFTNEHIRYWRQLQNTGVAGARNKAISMARGRYIAFLDSDDLWLPEKLERQLFFMKNNDYGFSYTEYRQFTDNPQNAGAIIKVKDFVDYKELLKGNDIGCLTVMLDREKFPEIKMPKERHEDYITWLNLLRNGRRAYGLHLDLARYRKSETSLTGNKWQSLKWTWDVYRKSQALSRYESIKNMYHYIIKGLKKHY